MSNLDIFDAEIQQLIPHANFWDYCKAGKYSTFLGISFVSNLKFIETNLLPRFQKIELILGLSDNGKDPVSKLLKGILDDRKENAGIIYDNEPLKQRILDGSLSFRFTKQGDTLIHNKFYLMFNDQEYQCFVGSMNLSRNAVTKNHENLVRFAGSIDDNVFKQFRTFWNGAQEWSSGYFDAQHLKGFLASTKKQTQINVYQDSVDNIVQNPEKAVGKDVYVVPQEKFKELHEIDDGKIGNFEELSKDEQLVIKQAVALTGPAGKLRQQKNLQHMGSQLFKVDQVVSYALMPADKKKATKARAYEDLYPRPLMTFNEETGLITSGKDAHHQDVLNIEQDKLTKEDAAIFTRIVDEYEDSKQDGEGFQACDFLLWLFEAPWLWKIRQLYYYNQDSAIVPEDVPLRVLLIGNGKSGKSTLAKRLASRLIYNIPEECVSPDDSIFKASTGSGKPAENNMNNFVTGYMRSRGLISTLLVDDAPTEYFVKPYFQRDLKGIANINPNDPYLGPAPAVAYSANVHDQDYRSTISMDSAILRRCYYLGFDSPLKPGFKDALDQLLHDANNHLYLAVQDRLRDFLIEQPMSVEREKLIEDDYLYPVKTVMKDLLEDYGLFTDRLKKFFARNYDFVHDRGQLNWQDLVSSKTYQKFITFVDHGTIANFPKRIFDILAGVNNRSNGLAWMHRYFNSLPVDMEISARCSDSGFNVNVERFDKFIGHSILEDLYAERTGLASHEQQSQMIAAAMKQAFDYHDQKQADAKKKHGIFGWLHRK